MVLYSEFTYGYQFSEETNGLEIRFLIPEILNKCKRSIFFYSLYLIFSLSYLTNAEVESKYKSGFSWSFLNLVTFLSGWCVFFVVGDHPILVVTTYSIEGAWSAPKKGGNHQQRTVEPFIQGPSERMSFLKLLVLGTENTIGAQICGKISIKVRHF